MTRSLLIAFTLATSLAALATLASAARAQSTLYCYTDTRTQETRCFATLQACSSAAVYVPGAYCSAR